MLSLAAADGASVRFDVPARMRDGVVLRADVYRPEGAGPWPTLLVRTPYDKRDAGEGVWSGLDPMRAARCGFMAVVQDVRGRFASDGAWEPFRFERKDGYDSVEWAARLPGSNGRVGMHSGSYCGNTQWQAAIERPPSLAAISPALTWADPMDGLLARGGAVELGLALRWALQHGFDTIGRRGYREEERARRVRALVEEWDRLDERGYWELPVAAGAALRRHGVPELGGIAALERAEVAELSRVSDSYERVEAPSFHTAGWYDSFLQGTLDNYAAMAATGREARLVVGPWSHLAFADPIGERLFGMRAGRAGVPDCGDAGWSELQLAWFRRQLEPKADVNLPQAPVRIFVMGRDEWRNEAHWPPRRALDRRWFLRADGSLTDDVPAADEGGSEFVYDPTDPVPTVGGNGVMSVSHSPGPLDQAAIEDRYDVLVFTSEPLEYDLEVTGRVRVVLHAASTAPSTDWVARLCDVYPDGRSIVLCDGILRVEAGADQGARREIDLWSTSNVFLAGHRVRVHVTSSSFPRWDRNLNTGDQRQARHVAARQRVDHAAERPSYVELPVIA